MSPLARKSRPRRTGLLCALCLALSGCQLNQLIILTNATSQPIRVRYTVPTFQSNPGEPQRCLLRVWPPKVRPTPAGNQWPASDWTTADAKLDEATCETDLVLEAGHSVLLDRNGFCDDYDRAGAVGALQPGFLSLVIQAGGRTLEWHGWDTARPFRRTSHGHCIYRVS